MAYETWLTLIATILLNQQTKIQSYKSAILNIKHHVPQGSIHEHLLFLLYII